MDTYRPKPKVFIVYDRAAFAGKEEPELRCRNGNLNIICGRTASREAL